MQKKQLLKKRMLALAISAAMVFASTGTYVVQAEEIGNLTATEFDDVQSGGTETEAEISEEDSNDPSNDSETEEGADSTSDSETTEGADSTSDSETEEGADSSSDSETTKETDSASTPETAEEPEGAIEENVQPSDDLVEETPENIMEEAGIDEVELLASDDDSILHSGKTNNISWKISASGKLTIEGTGDYKKAEWLSYWKEIKSAEVNVTGITSTKSMFEELDNMTSIDLSKLDTRNVTNMSNMFRFCGELTDLDVSKFDTSNVTNMSGMFSFCEKLTDLDVSKFDTSKVTNMTYMFYECKELTDLDVSNFDTRNVKSMRDMFADCFKLTRLDVSKFNTSNVTDMGSMFYNCWSLTELDVSKFDTSKVTEMDGMFSSCSKLTELDVSNFDTSKVTEINVMFSGCYNLTRLDVSNFDTSNVIYMHQMFNSCPNLTELDVSKFDTSKVISIFGMFDGCSKLTGLDLSSFDLSNCQENPNDFISGCKNLISGCKSLSYICAPIKCSSDIALPVSTATDKWYQENGVECEYLPTNLSESITLYKNGYPGDESGETKKVVFVSGITVNSKIYDKSPVTYEGNPVVKDAGGNTISGLSLSGCTYTGTLADGSAYTETSDAPSQAGKYTMSIVFSGDGVENYNIQRTSYNYSIKPKTLKITAPSVSIEPDEELPVLSGMECTVDGLLEGDSLITEPQIKYSAENIETSVSGRYNIIPYAADAGNNYQIEYVNGNLIIGDPEDDSPYEDAQRTDLKTPDLKVSIAAIKAKTYDGNPYEPTVKVTVTESGKKKTLIEGTDYRVSYEDNVDAGTGTVIIRGNGLYKGEVTETFKINPKSIKKLKIMAGSVSQNITAADIAAGTVELPVYVYDGQKLLTKGSDYNLTFKSSNEKTLTLDIESMQGSNYTGTATAKVTIYQGVEPSQIINPSNVTLEYAETVYTGKAIKPSVKVKVGDTSLTNKNYKVQYQNNKNVGTAYVIVTGKGSYKGKAVVPFVITQDNTAVLQITNSIKAKTYNGKLQKPSVTVKVGKTKLKKNKDYTVSYTKNLHEGTAEITVTGMGNYAGSASKTFIINPQKISKVSVKGTKTSGLTVTYGTRRLKEGTDYNLSYGATTKNKIKVTIEAIEGSDFTGSVTKTVKLQ